MKTAVLIVAGGSGTRMGSEIPKQFLPMAGKPVIVHTFEIFRKVLPDAAMYVALPEEHHDTWNKMAADHGLEGSYTICKGGDTRFMTVKNSLAAIDPCDIVLVHDAVRPLVRGAEIERVIEGADQTGACIPSLIPVDSFRIVNPDGTSFPTDRDRLRAIQTPQGFRYDLLKTAYNRSYDESFTDDASVVESYGHKVTLCQGSWFNIKITHPEDLERAEKLFLASEMFHKLRRQYGIKD